MKHGSVKGSARISDTAKRVVELNDALGDALQRVANANSVFSGRHESLPERQDRAIDAWIQMALFYEHEPSDTVDCYDRDKVRELLFGGGAEALRKSQ